MQYRRFSTTLIREALELLKAENGSDVYFSSGFISTHCKNGAILSIKSPLAFFEGCLHGFQVNGITKIRKKYLELGITSKYGLELKRGSFSTRVYLLPKKDETGLKLWDPDIQWQYCNEEVIQEICRASLIADQNSNSDQPAFSAVHICNGYLIASDNDFSRFARHKLSTYLPFRISLFSQDIKYLLTRVKGKRLLRIAELEILYDGSKTLGLAFDFGDLRMWLPSAGLEEKNQCHEPEQGGGFVTFGRKFLVNLIQEILNTPCLFMVILTSSPKPPFSAPVGDEPITIKFMSGMILFKYRDDNVRWKERLVFKDLEIRKPLKGLVNPHWFLQSYRTHRLMGVIDYDGHTFLYFKDRCSEQLLKVK